MSEPPRVRPLSPTLVSVRRLPPGRRSDLVARPCSVGSGARNPRAASRALRCLRPQASVGNSEPCRTFPGETANASGPARASARSSHARRSVVTRWSALQAPISSLGPAWLPGTRSALTGRCAGKLGLAALDPKATMLRVSPHHRMWYQSAHGIVRPCATSAVTMTKSILGVMT